MLFCIVQLWERLAIKLHEEQQILQKREVGGGVGRGKEERRETDERRGAGGGGCQGDLLDGLDHIPDLLHEDTLSFVVYEQVRKYLGQVC